MMGFAPLNPSYALPSPSRSLHGLRHTAGKTLADLGADPRMIQAPLGQRSLSMAIHYSQEADRRRAAAAALHVLERPIVVSGIKAALGRPPEKVLSVL